MEDLLSVGHNEFRIGRADVQNYRSPVRVRHSVVYHCVVQSHRGHLYLVSQYICLLEVSQKAVHNIVLDKEYPCDNVRRVRHSDRLVVPDHVIHIERNLLLSFEFHNLWNLFDINRRKSHESRLAVTPRNSHHHFAAFEAVFLSEFFQTRANSLVVAGCRQGRQRFRVVHRREITDLDTIPQNLQFDSSQAILTHIDAPGYLVFRGHKKHLLSKFAQIRQTRIDPNMAKP